MITLNNLTPETIERIKTIYADMESLGKMVWSVVLSHKATGELLQIPDYKGAVEIATIARIPNDLVPTFREAILELMSFLVSDDVAQPFDLTLAGSIP